MKVKMDPKTKYFVTSDLHFGHANIIKYSNRPFSSVEEMNEGLIDNWNSVVSDGDVVFNLGDFAFCKESSLLEYMKRLNGSQIFVYGNHDHILQRPIVREECISSGKVSMFCDYVEFSYKKTPICMSHYAMRVWNKRGYGAQMLYGHSHGTLPAEGRSMDVGVDTNDLESNYRPFELELVVEFLKTVEI